MSGGSWDYFYSRAQDVAERLMSEPSPERRALGRNLALIAKAMHDIEWVDSCDYGPGDDKEAIIAALGGSRDAHAAVLSVMIEDAQRIVREMNEQIRAAARATDSREGT